MPPRAPRPSPRPRRPEAGPRRRSSAARATPDWTFLSNHAHVLLCLIAEDAPRIRDVADRVGITERAVLGIVLDLEREGILERRRDGRRNRYSFHLDRPLRHPLETHRSVRALVDLLR